MLLKCHFDVTILRFPEIYTILLLHETTLETWFPWQEVKVHPETFDFKTFSINNGKKAPIFYRKIIFCGSKITEENLGGG